MKYIVYELWDPRLDQPFYVGWSYTANKGKARPYEHIKEALRDRQGGNQLKLNVIKKVLNEGYEIDIKIVFESDEMDESLLVEQQLIAKWGRRDQGRGPLTNMTDGGEGTAGRIDSDETRSKKSNGRLGKRHSRAAIEKIKEARKRQLPAVWTDESRKKMSERTHLRDNKNRTYQDIYGTEQAIAIKEKQAIALSKRRHDPEYEKQRIAAHRRTWIIKMADAYRAILHEVDAGKKNNEIAKALNISLDTVRKAIKNRTEIESILDENLANN